MRPGPADDPVDMTPTQRVTLGPGEGSVVVRTSKEGPMAKVAHDLVIEATSWQATVDLGGEPPVRAVALEVDPHSLVVRDGVGGVKPLSDDDRGRISSTIDAKVLHGKAITFRSDRILGDGPTLVVEGALTLAGQTHPLRATLEVDGDGAIRGTIPVTQTAWGITPHSAMMGQLRVGDDVEVVVEARLPVA